MRKNFYHRSPLGDTNICWGIDFQAVAAKHATEYKCPHGDCFWDFYEGLYPDLKTRKNIISNFYKNVVGFMLVRKMSFLTIKCPRCQRYMWVHNAIIQEPEDIVYYKLPARCPNWPKINKKRTS